MHPHQHAPRARLRVTVRPLQRLIAGYLLPQGEHEIEVPEPLIASIEALVETEEALLEVARKTYQKRLAAWIQQGGTESTCPESVEAAFHQIAGRDIRPLGRCEVLETGLPPKLDRNQREVAAVMAHIQAATNAERASHESPARRNKSSE